MKKFFLTILSLLVLFINVPIFASGTLWTEVSVKKRSANEQINLSLMPDKYTLYQLDIAGMRSSLKRAARSNEESIKTVSVPLPSGEMINIIVTETSVMAPELANKYPDIKTYKAVVEGRPAVSGVVNMNEQGFNAMLFMENGSRLFIDPRQSASGETYYISYYDKDYHPEEKNKPSCQFDEDSVQHSPIRRTTPGTLLSRSGSDLRTYRLALAATGEYTTYHGGTKSAALGAMTTSVSRVNEIYQRDLAVKLELVSNNDEIIYTNPTSDPYSDNENSDQLLSDNQPVADNVIGSANYDLGHVITHNGGGGVAMFESVCDSFYKAQAMTGHNNPVNDPFDIDYFAHELGHQFGGNHSFNAVDGGCNREATAAWEIGNGVTIMGYVGVCDSSNDVTSPANSIAMFHIGNIRQMSDFINSSTTGGSCGSASSLSNQQPTANAGSDYTIPSGTPFQLTGTGSDPNSGDSLSYTWEQIDLGTVANISDGDLGDNPLFRAFLPTNINSRTFPQLSDIINNTQTTGEILPTTSRSLNFVFTVRDQKGGVAEDTVKLTVVKTNTPFKLTSHTSSSSITAGSSVDISWTVGDTASTPINCANVDILMSSDSGNTFATYLAQQTSNDGAETVIIPASTIANSSTRFKVVCHDNIFFDISDADLTLASSSQSNSVASSVNEGDNSNHVNYFKLALSSPLSKDASVNFETRDGTAKAGEDYIATAGSATIKAGDSETLIGVTIIADTTSETDETFSLVITNPVNAAFQNSVQEVSATHTIVNDD